MTSGQSGWSPKTVGAHVVWGVVPGLQPDVRDAGNLTAAAPDTMATIWDNIRGYSGDSRQTYL